MTGKIHEFCDPIHTFIRLDSDERRIVDFYPFQRLRNICQLALTYLIYPGATHKRFEHSLGVMELAGRVFDVITNPSNIHDKVKKIVPKKDELEYWRRVLRMAALCHDIGHLPFSHSAESDLLKEGGHELMAVKIIKSKSFEEIWKELELNSDDIVKLAVGQKKLQNFPDIKFSDWEAILSEVIVDDALGVDRMDYLLRDSYYTGVVSGRFDHFRLIDTIKILPREDINSDEPALGVEEGGLRCAEALLLARYFMFSQVYFHPVRRICDLHLKDFLKSLFPKKMPDKIDKYLKITDNEILMKIYKASSAKKDKRYKDACRIVKREHFKLLYEGNPEDEELYEGDSEDEESCGSNPEGERIYRDALSVIYEEACERFGKDNLKKDQYKQEAGKENFPVFTRDRRIVSSLMRSQVLNNIPSVQTNYILASREIYDEAEKWLEKNRKNILNKKKKV